ncbi:hypothetical protein K466DRAFT_495705 [Polyporus arcularius HHB13444]|uniref:Zn(2)-C6 fungal-type domain-containing protein n=1 Tax=Polyporus arcularius HHB13444 TaxID=1314778 RepID=A0A5C3P7I9_9APHY|nr:hypothetical protein K466DRAFT_495705 [Polyporus arcularius HHB13444]
MLPTSSRLPPDGLTIMFEHCTTQPYYRGTSSGMVSGRSSPATPSSPSTPTDVYTQSPLDVAVASEDSWNLIPYDVPWGSEYYHYRAGTLPGPDGQCIFLRSPTPLKNRRTQKACNKCRQRKAKCSGTRPACTRCLARGYICEYVEEEKQDSKPEKRTSVSISRQHRHRQGSTSSSVSADASYSISDCESFGYPQYKLEEPSTPDLLYPDIDRSYESTSSPPDYTSHWDDSQYSMAASYGYEHPAESYPESAHMAEYYEQPSYVAEDAHAYHHHDASPMYHEVPEHHPAAAASVHAPRPVRCTGSPTFLSPQERMGAFPVPEGAHGMHGMQGMEEIAHNSMLLSLASGAEPAPQIALPQVPPMAPTEPALEEAAVAIEYAQPQGLYYYPTAEPAMQYPYLQYQYAVPTYAPGPAQEGIAPAMLYTMPMMTA